MKEMIDLISLCIIKRPNVLFRYCWKKNIIFLETLLKILSLCHFLIEICNDFAVENKNYKAIYILPLIKVADSSGKFSWGILHSLFCIGSPEWPKHMDESSFSCCM